MGWISSLDRRNKLLVVVFVTVLGTLLVASERVSVHGETPIYYDPIKKYDTVTYNASLSGTFSSDCKSGYIGEEEFEGYAGPVCLLPISKYTVSIGSSYSVGSTGGPSPNSSGYARRSYASIQRTQFVDPVKGKQPVSNGGQGGISGNAVESPPIDCQKSPEMCITATPYEYLGMVLNTKSKGIPGVNIQTQSEESSPLGNIFGALLYGEGIFGTGGVSDYNVGASTTIDLTCSDELNPSFTCGKGTVKEDTVIAGSKDVPASVYSLFDTKKKVKISQESDDSSDVRNPFYLYDKEVSKNDDCQTIWCFIFEQINQVIEEIKKVQGREKIRYLETNRSMAFTTRNLSEYNVAFNIPLSTVCKRFGRESPQCIQCGSEGSCNEFSVEETVEISGFGLSEKTTDYQTGFVNVFDSRGFTYNPLAASNVESYSLSASLGVSKGSVRNEQEGTVYEVAGKLPERQHEMFLQIGESLNHMARRHMLIPGYTCEFKGKITNGWIMRGDDVDSGGELLTIIGTSSADALAKGSTDALAIKVGATKVLTLRDLNAFGLKNGMNRYKEIGPTVVRQGGKIYTAFFSDHNFYLAVSSPDGTGDYSNSIVKLSEKSSPGSNNTRPIRMSFDGKGGLNVVFQSPTGECGTYAGDPKSCIYHVYISPETVSQLESLGSPKSASGSEAGQASQIPLVGTTTYIDENSYFLDAKPTKEGMVIVYTKGRSENNTTDIYVARVGGPSGIKLNYTGRDHAGKPEPFVFKVDPFGIRHLLILGNEGGKYLLRHAIWMGEETVNGESILTSLRLETIPLPLADKAGKITLDDFTFFMSGYYPLKAILYTVYPKKDTDPTEIVILMESEASKFRPFEGSETPIFYSVYEAYVIDSRSIVNWLAEEAKMPQVEGRSIHFRGGSIDVALQFGTYGWVALVDGSYSTTSRVWDDNYPSFAYVSDGNSSRAIPVDEIEKDYILGEDFVENGTKPIEGVVLPATVNLSLETKELAPGVKVADTKLPMLKRVDNYFSTQPSKASCWERLREYDVIDAPVPQTREPSQPVSPPPVPTPGTPPPTPPEPPTPPGPPQEPGGMCTESWCYMGDIYGRDIKSSPDQRGKMVQILSEKTSWGEQLSNEDCDGDGKINDSNAECKIKYLCDVADRNNVSCPFMMAIWYQESTWGINSNPSGNYLNFGCLLEDFTDSWEEQVICAIERAVVLRGQEWEASSGSRNICGEGGCCTAVTEFGYIMEKYTPTDTTPSHRNDDERKNLGRALRLMGEEGVIEMGDIITDVNMCRPSGESVPSPR